MKLLMWNLGYFFFVLDKKENCVLEKEDWDKLGNECFSEDDEIGFLSWENFYINKIWRRWIVFISS